MTQAQVIAQIQQFIIANGNQEITANVLRPILEAICNQANEKVGTLTNLATSEQGSVVGSINELYQLIEDNSGVVIHQGSDNPNDTPPVSFSITDYYIQDDNGVISLWQYTPTEWIKIKKQSTPVKFRYFSNDWNNGNSSSASLLSYANSITLLVENELTYFYSLKPVGSQSQGQQAEAHFWIFNKGAGVYGQNGTTLTGSDFRYMGPVSYSDSETVWDLGEIGTNTIESIVNQSGPFDVLVGGVNLFKALRNGVTYNYFYVGQETPIGLGEYQTNNDEYVEVAPGDNVPPDLSDYVTYEDFQKAFYDLNDFILTDILDNFTNDPNFNGGNFYLIEADEQPPFYHFAVKDYLAHRFTNFGVKFANTSGVRHDLTSADYVQDGYHIWKLPNVTTYFDLQNNPFQVWFNNDKSIRFDIDQNIDDSEIIQAQENMGLIASQIPNWSQEAENEINF